MVYGLILHTLNIHQSAAKYVRASYLVGALSPVKEDYIRAKHNWLQIMVDSLSECSCHTFLYDREELEEVGFSLGFFFFFGCCFRLVWFLFCCCCFVVVVFCVCCCFLFVCCCCWFVVVFLVFVCLFVVFFFFGG